MSFAITARSVRRLLMPALLAASVGCDPLGPSGGAGCEPPPKATDAAFSEVTLVNSGPPCFAGLEVVRGSTAHLFVHLTCPGEGDAFLVAVSIDGTLQFLQPAEPAGYGGLVIVDTGTWSSPDSLWHQVDVVVDPLNVFPETDESNNRGHARIRMIDPDAVIDASRSGFVIPYPTGDGYTLVDHVAAGTEVETHLRMTYGGPYSGVTRSVRSGAVLIASDTAVYTACDQPSWPIEDMTARWTPPGPGVYDVEFRITPLGGLPDRPANDVVVKRLTVTTSAAGPSPVRERSVP